MYESCKVSRPSCMSHTASMGRQQVLVLVQHIAAGVRRQQRCVHSVRPHRSGMHLGLLSNQHVTHSKHGDSPAPILAGPASIGAGAMCCCWCAIRKRCVHVVHACWSGVQLGWLVARAIWPKRCDGVPQQAAGSIRRLPSCLLLT